jgi:hypothetical protein
MIYGGGGYRGRISEMATSIKLAGSKIDVEMV